MQTINFYSILKPSKDEFDVILKEYQKMISRYAKVNINYIFNKDIAKAQTIGENEAKKTYTNAYLQYLDGYNIALDVLGKKVDSFEFAKLLENDNVINFFIGGAYGFEKDFLDKCDKIISLSALTFAHKVANVVLLEQTFRGVCILNNHPYHK